MSRPGPTPVPPRAWRPRWPAARGQPSPVPPSRGTGTTATPNPAATRPSTVGISVASNTMSGSTLSSASSWSVSCRSPACSPSATNGSPAAADSRTLARPASRCSERNGEAQLIDIEPAPDEAARLGARGGDREIGLTVEYPPRDLVRRALEQIETDPGRRLAKASQLLGHIPIRQGMEKREPDPAGVRIAKGGNAFGGGPHLGDAAPGVLQHDLAVCVQPEPAVDAVEQSRARLAFESRQCPRQRRLAHPQLSGGLGDVLGLGEHDEPLQFLEVHRSAAMCSAARWLNNRDAPIGLPPPGYVVPDTAAIVFPAA